MATIGRGDAVLQMPIGLKLKGVLAWLGWIVLHIVYLLGNRNRLADPAQPRSRATCCRAAPAPSWVT